MSAPATAGSRVIRPGADFSWPGLSIRAYRPETGPACGITRRVLVGERGEATGFDLRYFEIAPGGASAYEEHVHTHTVVILRGHGQVTLGNEVHDLAFGDTVYVAPHEWHQFRNIAADEPLGFLCLVDAQR